MIRFLMQKSKFHAKPFYYPASGGMPFDWYAYYMSWEMKLQLFDDREEVLDYSNISSRDKCEGTEIHYH